VEESLKSRDKPPRKKAAHLMCGTPFWGVAAAAACAYFAYSAYAQLRADDFDWQHGWWTLATWIIWVLLIAGLFFETRCWRERTFFGVLFLNFLLGFTVAAWSSASPAMVRDAREISLVLWTLSALASLLTVMYSAPFERGER